MNRDEANYLFLEMEPHHFHSEPAFSLLGSMALDSFAFIIAFITAFFVLKRLLVFTPYYNKVST